MSPFPHPFPGGRCPPREKRVESLAGGWAGRAAEGKWIQGGLGRGTLNRERIEAGVFRVESWIRKPQIRHQGFSQRSLGRGSKFKAGYFFVFLSLSSAQPLHYAQLTVRPEPAGPNRCVKRLGLRPLPATSASHNPNRPELNFSVFDSPRTFCQGLWEGGSGTLVNPGVSTPLPNTAETDEVLTRNARVAPDVPLQNLHPLRSSAFPGHPS